MAELITTPTTLKTLDLSVSGRDEHLVELVFEALRAEVADQCFPNTAYARLRGLYGVSDQRKEVTRGKNYSISHKRKICGVLSSVLFLRELHEAKNTKSSLESMIYAVIKMSARLF